MASAPRWDIFCRIIDNFGDIGVCWRLARQLAVEHGIAVRLWLDDLASLNRLCPEVDPHADQQQWHGIDIRRWPQPWPATVPGDVVIEAFGCDLPDAYLEAMARHQPAPVWINLEYLSAENWVAGCHALPSPHPRLPLNKFFFFPGFTPATGGLLREAGLLERRNRLQQSPQQLWQALRLPQPDADEYAVSLFCYPTAPLEALLQAWQRAAGRTRCLLPECALLDRIAACLDCPPLAAGDVVLRGSLTLQVLPFLRQEDYDLLLWACDCNFVRGEDSFVRAQWAGKPMIWQIYVQQEDAHRIKLDAFLDRYCASLESGAAAAVRAMHTGWNGMGELCWEDFRQHDGALQAHAGAWAEQLAGEPDLASKLVIFCENTV